MKSGVRSYPARSVVSELLHLQVLLLRTVLFRRTGLKWFLDNLKTLDSFSSFDPFMSFSDLVGVVVVDFLLGHVFSF